MSTATAPAHPLPEAAPAASTPTGLAAATRRQRRLAYWQAMPLGLVFLVFFLVPLALTLIVSFWEYNEYEIIPAFTFQNYKDVFEGCLSGAISAPPSGPTCRR